MWLSRFVRWLRAKYYLNNWNNPPCWRLRDISWIIPFNILNHLGCPKNIKWYQITCIQSMNTKFLFFQQKQWPWTLTHLWKWGSSEQERVTMPAHLVYNHHHHHHHHRRRHHEECVCARPPQGRAPPPRRRASGRPANHWTHVFLQLPTSW